MILVPRDYIHKKPQLVKLQFSTAASGASGAPGTGIRYVPVYWQLSASGVGSGAIYAGTAGSELLRLKWGAAANIDGCFWDNEGTANKRLVLEVEGAVGIGEFNVWYVAKRAGAGDSGTTQ